MFLSAALLALAILLGDAFAQNSTTSSTLQFGPVTFAGYKNYVYRDNITSAQVLLSE